MSYKAMAHIHSLNGEMAEITILEEVGDNDYIVDYKGVKCVSVNSIIQSQRKCRSGFTKR